jgi:hypothetical protein
MATQHPPMAEPQRILNQHQKDCENNRWKAHEIKPLNSSSAIMP